MPYSGQTIPAILSEQFRVDHEPERALSDSLTAVEEEKTHPST
jgi:hypothetical protein